MREALKAAHKDSQIIIYPEAPHGFNADYRPSYRDSDASSTALHNVAIICNVAGGGRTI
jgi:dienelactone hydrolase